MDRKNVASGNDRVAMQVGRVLGRPVKPAAPSGETAPSTSTVVNVRSGNAQVGEQTDVIVGGLHIRR